MWAEGADLLRSRDKGYAKNTHTIHNYTKSIQYNLEFFYDYFFYICIYPTRSKLVQRREIKIDPTYLKVFYEHHL